MLLPTSPCKPIHLLQVRIAGREVENREELMGNCQAIDNATIVIQHPCGKEDKLYWPVAASEVMKSNPGHYVALLLTTTTFCRSSTATAAAAAAANNSVRITRIKLLRPTDTLILGQVYRLITTEEVMKGLWAKKYAKMKKKQSESADHPTQERVKENKGSDLQTPPRRSDVENTNQVLKHEGHHRPRRTVSSANIAIAKSRAWQPSLQSISEATS